MHVHGCVHMYICVFECVCVCLSLYRPATSSWITQHRVLEATVIEIPQDHPWAMAPHRLPGPAGAQQRKLVDKQALFPELGSVMKHFSQLMRSI